MSPNYIFWRSKISQKALTDLQLSSILNCEYGDLFLRDLYSYTKSRPDGDHFVSQKLKALFDSPFPLCDWSISYNYFRQELTKGQKNRDFIGSLEYIYCAIQSPEAKMFRGDLISIVKINLETYGIL